MKTLSSILIAAILLTSCNVQKQAIKKRQWIERNNPVTLLKYCASIAKVDTLLIKGKDSIIQNYVVIPSDTVFKTKEKEIKLPCPPIHIRIDTFKIHSVDTAGMGVLRAEMATNKEKAIEYKTKFKTAQKWALITGGLALLSCIGIGLIITKR